ncbi:MAG: shikimate kinase [Elainellaceae cyanobacterium]
MELKQRLKNVNIYLIGMMGAGKSTVGRVIADALGYRFIDVDDVIEQVTHRAIAQIFSESGEEAFRDIEAQVLAELSAYPRLAIATGGGIVLRRQNWSYLHHGIVVWLDAPVEVLYARLQGNTTRPLLQTPNPQQKLQDILHHRQSLYAQADVRVPISSNESPHLLANRILDAIAQVLKPESSPVPLDLDPTQSSFNDHATDA